MPGKFSAGLTQTSVSSATGATGSDAVGELQSAATVRPRVYDIIFSQGGTPADNVVRWEVTRATTSATGTAAVENALDPAWASLNLAVCEEEITVGPTVTADTQMLDFDLNQRATFRWVAAPGSEIILPATAASGVFFNCS